MRLNKIAKDFNVGIQTLVEFLEKKTGVTIEGPVAMANVTDEQYELLRKEFNKDKSVKEESDRERQERQQTRDKIKEESRLKDIKVIATGGLGAIVSDETKSIDVYNKNLTLEGLRLVYNKNNR